MLSATGLSLPAAGTKRGYAGGAHEGFNGASFAEIVDFCTLDASAHHTAALAGYRERLFDAAEAFGVTFS